MRTRTLTKIVREGEYMAEVDVELIDSDEGWSPYLSLDEAYKLDDVRKALQEGDTTTAAKYGRVYRLTPVKQ
jgi:hypothetical protein